MNRKIKKCPEHELNAYEDQLNVSDEIRDSDDDVVVKSAELLIMFWLKDRNLKVVWGLVDVGCSENLGEESLMKELEGSVATTAKSTKWNV